MNRPGTGALALLALLLPAVTPAHTLTIAPSDSAGFAFARYIASTHRRDPFKESGPVVVVIEASLPGLQRKSRWLAIRDTDESERSRYTVLGSEGDPSVTQEVIVPYLALQRVIEDLPLSAVIVTPLNYHFRFMGPAGTGRGSAYVFRIAPKKKREGLVRGQLWLDSETGLAIVEAGSFVKVASAEFRRVEIVSDTTLRDGSPASRITQVRVVTRHDGRGYLTITEFPPASVSRSASIGE